MVKADTIIMALEYTLMYKSDRDRAIVMNIIGDNYKIFDVEEEKFEETARWLNMDVERVKKIFNEIKRQTIARYEDSQ